MEKLICPGCDKEYTNEKYYNLHIEKCDKISVSDEKESSKELIEESDTIVSIEKDNVLDLKKYNFEKIAKQFKMTGGYSGKNIENINFLYTHFTDKMAYPTSCGSKMIHRCAVIAGNYYKNNK